MKKTISSSVFHNVMKGVHVICIYLRILVSSTISFSHSVTSIAEPAHPSGTPELISVFMNVTQSFLFSVVIYGSLFVLFALSHLIIVFSVFNLSFRLLSLVSSNFS